MKKIIMKEKRERNIRMYLRITPKEHEIIEKKMNVMGIQNFNLFARKMLLNGFCIYLDLECIQNLSYQVNRLGNNLNQYTQKANEIGAIYQNDIQELKQGLYNLQSMTKNVLKKLSQIP